MTERHEQFEVGDRPEVQVEFPSGTLRVVAGEPNSVTVRVSGRDAGAFEISERRERVRVRLSSGSFSRWRDHDVVVAVPAETALTVRVASAAVTIPVGLRRLDVHSASGDVDASAVTGHATLKTASGSVRLGAAGGEIRMSSAAGDIDVGSVEGSVGLNTVGGDVRLGRVGGALAIRSASGDVAVDRYAGADLSCSTVSGDVRIGLEPGRTVDLDLFSLAGHVVNEFAVEAPAPAGGLGTPGRPGGQDGEDPSGGRAVGRLRVRSTAGDILLARVVAV